MVNSSKRNLNYLFYKAYYDESNDKNYDKCNKDLCERAFNLSEKNILFPTHSFRLKTTYPGLLIGIGNTHAAGNNIDKESKKEIKLGFTLDYVTGLPIIPGSTIKGILRSAFDNYGEFVSKLLGNIEITELTKKIFAEGTEKIIFYDAIPVRANESNHLFGLDNITPHYPDLLENPIPLTMLKVLPEVVYMFRFGFDRWNNFSGVDSEALLDAFKNIILTLGVGAKTNVGYGAMEETEEIAVEGVCQKCGAKTGFNKKTNKVYQFCNKCNSKKK